MSETAVKTKVDTTCLKHFEFIEYKPEHAIEIITNGAKEPGLVFTKLTAEWAQIMGQKGPCTTGIFDGKVVSCAGIFLAWPGVGEQWAVNVKAIGDYHIDPQIGKRWLYNQIDEYKLWRVQVPARSDFPVGESYLRWLGFEFEATLENYHPDGTDARMYKIITKKYLNNKET